MNLRNAVLKVELLRLEERARRIRVRGMTDKQLLSELREAAATREAYMKMAEAAIAYADHCEREVVDREAYDRKRADLLEAYRIAMTNTL